MKQTIDKPYSKVSAEHGAQAYLKDDKQMVGLPGPFYQGIQQVFQILQLVFLPNS